MKALTEAEVALVRRVRGLTGRSNLEGLADYLLDEPGRALAISLCRRSILKSHRWRGVRWFRCGRLAGAALRVSGETKGVQP